MFSKWWRSPGKSPLHRSVSWRGLHWQNGTERCNSSIRPCWGAVSHHCWHLVRFVVGPRLPHYGLHLSPHLINIPSPSTAEPWRTGLQWKHSMFTWFATCLLVGWQACRKAGKKISWESSWNPTGMDQGKQPASSISTRAAKAEMRLFLQRGPGVHPEPCVNAWPLHVHTVSAFHSSSHHSQ